MMLRFCRGRSLLIVIKTKKRTKFYFLLCEGEPIGKYPSFEDAEDDMRLFQALDCISGVHYNYEIEYGYF